MVLGGPPRSHENELPPRPCITPVPIKRDSANFRPCVRSTGGRGIYTKRMPIPRRSGGGNDAQDSDAGGCRGPHECGSRLRGACRWTEQCAGRPCTGTSTTNVLYERPGNGTPDAIYGRSGRDVLRADEHTRDTDRLYGNRGRDKLNVLDGETRDKASGGPGRDTCYIDSSREIGPSCEVLLVS